MCENTTLQSQNVSHFLSKLAQDVFCMSPVGTTLSKQTKRNHLIVILWVIFDDFIWNQERIQIVEESDKLQWSCVI